MKVRSGFVSNSSTSSFVCKVCGCIEAGRDATLEEFEMFSCENYHTIHEECADICIENIVPEEYLKEYVRKYRSDDCDDEESREEARGEFRDNVPATYCPVCSFKKLSIRDELEFLRKETGMSKKDVIKKIKSKFKDYKEFKEKIYQ
jgi:hypothetical protein